MSMQRCKVSLWLFKIVSNKLNSIWTSIVQIHLQIRLPEMQYCITDYLNLGREGKHLRMFEVVRCIKSKRDKRF